MTKLDSKTTNSKIQHLKLLIKMHINNKQKKSDYYVKKLKKGEFCRIKSGDVKV
jgi:hypothetical protein